MKFAERGEVNRDLVAIVRTNVREPNQVVGDFYSLAACNDVGHRRLVDMLSEIRPRLARGLGAFIFSRTSVARCWSASPRCRRPLVSNELLTDGYDEPVNARRRRVDVGGDRMYADFAGTDAVSRWGINVPSSTPRLMPATG